jgi:hypothetical protein
MTKIRSGLLGAAIVGSLFSFLSTGAFADFKPTAAERSDCMGDAMSLCSHAIPNVDRVLACLVSKKSQLSPSCRAHFDKH